MAARICPVCGGQTWTPDYTRIADGDEMRVDRCDTCGWPPASPFSVAEYRRWWKEGFPRLADDEGKATEAWERIKDAEA